MGSWSRRRPCRTIHRTIRPRPIIRIQPSRRDISPSISSTRASNMMMNIKGYSRRRVSDLTSKGVINAVVPSTSAILVILEPSALPTPSAGFPCQAAMADTKISGAEVPMPTMVSPIIIGETPRFRAVAAAPCTNRSAPQTRNTKPTMTAKEENNNPLIILLMQC